MSQYLRQNQDVVERPTMKNTILCKRLVSKIYVIKI